jgi:DNA anti-recombination protein RmuC
MADQHTITAPAPAEITTTVQQPTPHNVETASFSVKDVSIVLAIVVALTIIVGFFLNNARIKRKEDQEDARVRTQSLMDAIKTSHDDSARDVRELSDKVKDGRTVLEKDMETLRSKIDHEARNRSASDQAASHLIEKASGELRELDRRMTTQEEKSRNQDHALNELKAILREKIDETKELIKSQGETSTAQFKELSNSIREARDSKFKA